MNMCEHEFNSLVFKGRASNESVSLESVFSLEQLLDISNSDEYKYFSEPTKSWIWAAIDNLAFNDK